MLSRPILLLLAVLLALTACATHPMPTTAPASSSPLPAFSLPSASADLLPSPSSSGSKTGEQPWVPDDFPVMPGMVPLEPRDAVTLAEWQTDATGREAYEFYQQALPSAGYVIEADMPGGAAAALTFRTPDGTRLDLGVMTVGPTTFVSLAVPFE